MRPLLAGVGVLLAWALGVQVPASQDRPPAELSRFVPAAYEVLDFATGDLDADGRPDAALVLKKANEDPPQDGADVPRPLLLLIRQADGTLKLACRADHVVYCRDCGGAMGDPYQGIEVGTGRFTVSAYGGSAWRWSNADTFVYDAARRDWFLERTASESFHAADPEGTRSKVVITREELGDVPLATFDYASAEQEASRKWRVVAARAHFYDQPDLRSAPRKAFLVRGDVVESSRDLRHFVQASFTNSQGRSTDGFLLKTDLEPVPAPRGR